MARPILRAGVCVAGFLIAGGVFLPAAHGQTTSASGAKGRAKAQSYAFLVAVQDYDGDEFRPLEYTRRDIEDFRRVLVESGFPADNIVLLHDRQKYRFLPLADNIRKELELLLRRIEKGDTLVVALSGHGVQLRAKEKGKHGTPYFCPADARLKDRKNLIGLEELYRRIKACPGGHKLLLVDACRNDPLIEGRGLPDTDLETLTGQRLPLPEATAALFSCSSGERSFERKDLGHGVFFYHVIQGWQGAAADADGRVTLEGLAAYTKRETIKYLQKVGRATQRPYLRTSLEGEWVLRQDFGLPQFTRGLAALGRQDFDEALRDFSRAIGLNPLYAEAYCRRAEAHLGKKEYLPAVADCSHALSLRENYPAAYLIRASAYSGKKRYNNAIADYDKVIELDPKNAIAHCGRGWVYQVKKKYAKAIADYNKAIDLDPTYVWAYNNRAVWHHENKQYRKAIADCTTAIKLNPNLALPWNNRGRAYLRLKKYRKAISNCNKAIKIEPTLSYPYYNRSRAYRALGNKAQAEADMKTQIRLSKRK
jgi:tetratricopeptide (TPR) repeat protein